MNDETRLTKEDMIFALFGFHLNAFFIQCKNVQIGSFLINRELAILSF